MQAFNYRALQENKNITKFKKNKRNKLENSSHDARFRNRVNNSESYKYISKLSSIKCIKQYKLIIRN